MGYSVPLMQQAVTVAGIANGLQGTPIEFLSEAAIIDIYGNGDALGIAIGITGYKGGEPGVALIPPASGLSIAGTAGKVKVNEDFLSTIHIPAGGMRLVMPVTSAGTSKYNLLFVIR